MSNTIPLWAIIVIAIVAVLAFAHAQRYFRAFKDESFTIVQAGLEDATPDILSEWSPLIVQDRLVDPPAALSSTLLRWQYVWKGKTHLATEKEERSVCRFTVMFSTDPETMIVLKKKHEDPGVEIRLTTGRSLIIPPGFVYSVKENFRASQVRFHDSATLLLSALA